MWQIFHNAICYLCNMLPDDDLQQRWLALESRIAATLGQNPTMEEVLIFVGLKESGWPPKKIISAKEQTDLIQMAVCTILVSARYYEMMWVDDFGWPYFREVNRLPAMTTDQRNDFLKPHLVAYAEKKRII